MAVEAAQVSLLRWLRRQLAQPTAIREHLEAAVENHLADILHAAGRRDESMVHLKRAVALFAEVGEGAPERDPGIWALAAW